MKRTRNPNEAEADSFATESEEVKVKLTEEKVEVNGDDASPSQQLNRKHYCDICRRQFSSGKAYGGHKRIHTTEPKNKGKNKGKKEEEDVDLVRADVEDEFKCILCGKEFQTKHSLFGHMRNHPERGWKGIRPPSPEKCEYSDSSEYDDDDDDDDDDGDYVAEDVYEAACILMTIHCSPVEYWMRESMESANKDDDKKDLDVDMKIKMEIKVKLTYPQDEAKRL